jgi:hypothetical protein
MFLSSGIASWSKRWGGGHSVGHHPDAKEGTIMDLLIVAIIAIAGLGLYRFMRTRNAS